MEALIGSGCDQRRKVLGFPTLIECERVIQGELAPENFDIVSYVVGRVDLANVGHCYVTQIGRGLSVKFVKGWVTGSIEIQSRGGKTRLFCRASSSHGVSFWILFAFIWVFLLMAVVQGGPVLGFIVLGVGCLIPLAFFVPMRRSASASLEGVQRKVDEIAAKIAEENDALRQNLASNGGVVSGEEVSIHE